MGATAQTAAAATGDAVALAAALAERLRAGLSPAAWSVVAFVFFLAMSDI
jgi:hypothetical protein